MYRFELLDAQARALVDGRATVMFGSALAVPAERAR